MTAPKDVTQLVQGLKDLRKEIEEGVGETMRLAGSQIVSGLVSSTPVDTGHARGNWLTSLNAIDDSIVTRNNEPQGRADRVLLDVKHDDVIYITNHVDYIVHLNQGSSRQAPSGFVETSIDLVVSEVPNMARQAFADG